ncbi:MAG: hypothetical protein Q9166_001012 [cf. Caloplaca sp. 2 TL-2023]
MNEELQTQDSVQTVAYKIGQRILREVTYAHACLVTIRTHVPNDLKSTLENAEFAVYEQRPSPSPGSEPMIAYDGSETNWCLQIATQGDQVPREYNVGLSLSWPTFNLDHDRQHPREQYWARRLRETSLPCHQKPWPTFDVHREIASFIESRTHASLNILALEAAQLAFPSLERIVGQHPSSAINIRIAHAGKGLKNPSSRFNTTYRFNAPWYHSYRQALNRFGTRHGYSRAFVALGSNVGNRISMIEQACSEMTRRGIRVLRSSSLYETEAMYKTDQRKFINGACEVCLLDFQEQIDTTLSPIELLDQLKDIEASLGRVKTIENGPRSIDLDILLYDDQLVNEERLQIPHPRISEREFVLRPLCDLIPRSIRPDAHITDTSILLDYSSQLLELPPSPTPLSPIIPLRRFTSSSSNSRPSQILTSDLPNRKTHLMAILNLTPDSFSNDGLFNSTFTPSSLLAQLQSLLHHRVSILDIGGQSTRPHASPLGAQEELARVLPTIKFIRQDPTFNNILIAIDTYHSSVAKACIEAGADIINDISGGLMDENMFATVAELGCTYILMHMRGTPETMTTLTQYPDGVINGIATELNERVQKAMEAGIRRWRIILDPGIGFAKTADQNLEVIRKLPELREWEGLKGLPWCVGVSRKGFIGKVTAVGAGREDESGPRYVGMDNESNKRVEGEARGDAGPGVKEGDGMRERVWGTAAAVTACVQGGADVVRVHDWEEMGRVVRMGEAVWRV